MAIVKVLKKDTEHFKKLEDLFIYLDQQRMELHQTVYNGIIFKLDDKFYKYDQDGSYPETLPPFSEGRYVLCDHHGNTDFYND
jgi:hypothetical protein